MSWTRTYRPAAISELHNDQARNVLLKYLKDGRIPQVLLFSGPKGTGKTSASRLIGAVLNDPTNLETVQAVYMQGVKPKKSLNDVSENKISSSILRGVSTVVQELDAASNRRIDDVRSLQERIHLPPQEGPMAVYILDEVHMLTKEAFNALLKLLEEPPKHVVFILATTERDKVPDTIRSRCQEISFNKATIKEMSVALENINKLEKIGLSKESLERIAEQADGSFRDAVKIIEHLSITNTVSDEAVLEEISYISSDELESLLKIIVAKDAKKILTFFAECRKKNLHPTRFYTQFIEYLHAQMSAGYNNEPTIVPVKVARFLLTQLQGIAQIEYSPLPFLPLELALLDIVARASAQSNSGSNDSGSSKSTKKQSTKTAKDREAHSTNSDIYSKELISSKQPEIITESTYVLPKENEVVVATIRSESGPSVSADFYQEEDLGVPGDAELAIKHWNDFTSEVSEHNFSLAALLKSATPELITSTKIRIKVFYQFHKEQLSQPKFKHILSEILQSLCGGTISIEFEVTKAPPAAQLREVSDQPLEQLAAAALM